MRIDVGLMGPVRRGIAGMAHIPLVSLTMSGVPPLKVCTTRPSMAIATSKLE